MRTLTHVIDHPSRADTFTLHYLTDFHLGARACDENLLRRDIQAIASDPNARWIGGGDYLDCIARTGDKRYLESTVAKWLYGKNDVIGIQRDYFVDMVSPIMDKCLGLVRGNHEEAALKYLNREIYWELVTFAAQRKGVQPQALALGVQGFVVLKFRRGDAGKRYHTHTLTVYCHHGFGGGRLPGGDALALGRTLGDYECDIALMGHRHTRHYVDKVIVRSNNRTQTRVGLFVPSYLGAYIIPAAGDRLTDTYPELIGLPPRHLGTIPIKITPGAERVDVIFSSTVGLTPVLEMEQAA